MQCRHSVSLGGVHVHLLTQQRAHFGHVSFHRQVGEFAGIKATPDGAVLSDADWAAQKDRWLPSKADGDFIQGLMEPCWEPGKFASWIAPPKVGIDNKSGDFEYVKIHRA